MYKVTGPCSDSSLNIKINSCSLLKLPTASSPPDMTSDTLHPPAMIPTIKQVLNPFIPGTAVFKLPGLRNRTRDASTRNSTQAPHAAPRVVTIEDLDHLFPTLEDYQRRRRRKEKEPGRPLVEDHYEHPALEYYENLRFPEQAVTHAGPTDYKMDLNKEDSVAEKESDQKSVSEWSMLSMTKEKTGDSKTASDDKHNSKKHGQPSDGSKKKQAMSNENESNMSLESAVLVNALGNQSTDSLAASIGTQSSASFGDTSGDIGDDDVPVYMRLDFWDRGTIIEETEEQLVSHIEKEVVLSVRDDASFLGNSKASPNLSATNVVPSERSEESRLSGSMASPNLGAANLGSAEQSKESRLSGSMATLSFGASIIVPSAQSEGARLSSSTASLGLDSWNIVSDVQSKGSRLSFTAGSLTPDSTTPLLRKEPVEKTQSADQSEGSRSSFTFISLTPNSSTPLLCKEPAEKPQSTGQSEASRMSFTLVSLSPNSSTPVLREEKHPEEPQSAGHSSVNLPGSSATASIHGQNQSKGEDTGEDKGEDKGDDKGDDAEGDAEKPKATPPVARKPYKDPTLWVRGFTGTLLKGAAPGKPARPDDSRSWDCKILWCIECRGPCPICGKPCCVRWGCDEYLHQPIADRQWLKSRRCFMVNTLLDRYGNLTRDHSTYTVCTEPGGCGRYVCSNCCGICSTPMCRDIQCKDCKPNPWGPCDWHEA
ncbi:hypothetical protein BO86DRAFT_443165 [Aspergillus japonicus CBS 114.51]|uniref:Uncharacterized protein n=1 Tax=Aspergillus japonicus CBS 114.51 TaxID=1448312 RepID=A0A8T8WLE1_ASPJA|nr:hypothetical protein BO86DRAFT_443165 [Aspergillus japonicus CBS 114.51]RAH76658.1 hypothetical protein BO86DRAFT_443165 [Aspergillus japonicus CBS 114.51]